MPKVLLDLRMVRGRLHGIARYALELFRRLPAVAPADWRFEALVPPEGLARDVETLLGRAITHRARSAFLSPWEQLDLPARIAGSGCDLFHATSFSLPALWGGALVATLHDANHLDRAGDYGLRQRLYFSAVVGPRARHARALLTVSRFSQHALAAQLGIPDERFQITSPGVGVEFQTPDPRVLERFHRRHALPARYFLAVGNEKGFKNLSLIARIASKLPAPVVLLAGPGAAGRLGFPSSTLDLSQVEDEALPSLYAGAAALLLPSRYEGFGLPALEAMACGCPVLAARAGALPEVVGEAGVLLDPDADDAWIRAARSVMDDSVARARQIEAGRVLANRFSWDLCARETFAAYQRAHETRS